MWQCGLDRDSNVVQVGKDLCEAQKIVDGPVFCLGSDSSSVTKVHLYGPTYKMKALN